MGNMNALIVENFSSWSIGLYDVIYRDTEEKEEKYNLRILAKMQTSISKAFYSMLLSWYVISYYEILEINKNLIKRIIRDPDDNTS